MRKWIKIDRDEENRIKIAEHLLWQSANWGIGCYKMCECLLNKDEQGMIDEGLEMSNKVVRGYALRDTAYEYLDSCGVYIKEHTEGLVGKIGTKRQRVYIQADVYSVGEFNGKTKDVIGSLAKYLIRQRQWELAEKEIYARVNEYLASE